MADNDGVMAERTPGPWETDQEFDGQCVVGEDGFMVADCSIVSLHKNAPTNERCKANAAFIVKAVNMHDRLVTALDGLITASELVKDAWDQEDAYRIFEQAQQNARALLTEAGEQQG